ncbi:MAG: TlpA family protein disulfide reductase [Leptospiraceae bacterium]|nr:TlpA family protein disulfide reductase [Leptospiraceae bacterium]MCB1169868.1 TlpA family protein disulfide reductase [Leptospiraceae bacterium]
MISPGGKGNPWYGVRKFERGRVLKSVFFAFGVSKTIAFSFLAMIPSVGESQPVQEYRRSAENLEFPREAVRAPAFRLEAMDGSQVSLSQFRGQVVILHFWATFCAPCGPEMKSLHELQTDPNMKGLQVVTISIDALDSSVLRFLRERKLHAFIALRDRSSSLRQAYQVDALPMSYVIDASGKIRARMRGALNWQDPPVREFLKKLLEQGFFRLP